jgi:hypothetical protein
MENLVNLKTLSLSGQEINEMNSSWDYLAGGWDRPTLDIIVAGGKSSSYTRNLDHGMYLSSSWRLTMTEIEKSELLTRGGNLVVIKAIIDEANKPRSSRARLVITEAIIDDH